MKKNSRAQRRADKYWDNKKVQHLMFIDSMSMFIVLRYLNEIMDIESDEEFIQKSREIGILKDKYL